MSKITKTPREAPVSYRPPASLKSEFDERVRKSGLSKSAYITKCIFGTSMPRQVRRAPIEKQLIAIQLSVLAELKDEIRRVEAGEPDDETTNRLLNEINSTLIEIRSSLLSAMGNKP